eukprot:6176315-Pleurochrysis_carterae.AAC.4
MPGGRTDAAPLAQHEASLLVQSVRSDPFAFIGSETASEGMVGGWNFSLAYSLAVARALACAHASQRAGENWPRSYS